MLFKLNLIKQVMMMMMMGNTLMKMVFDGEKGSISASKVWITPLPEEQCSEDLTNSTSAFRGRGWNGWTDDNVKFCFC
ncbi:MAG: hypothetical protein ACJZZ9_08665 [Cytophagales bacterium]